MTTRKAKAKPKRSDPSRSGPTIHERDRADRGQGRLNLRLPLDVLEMLANEAERQGATQSELVEGMVRMDLDGDYRRALCITAPPAPAHRHCHERRVRCRRRAEPGRDLCALHEELERDRTNPALERSDDD